MDFKSIFLASSFLVTESLGFLALLLVTLWEILDRTGPVMMSADFPVCRAGDKQWAGGNVRVVSAAHGQ